MIIKKSIALNCSKEKLWEWLTEFEKIKSWNPDILEEEVISSGEVQPGFKSRMLILEGRKKNWYENEIQVFEPESELSTLLRGGGLGEGLMRVDYQIEVRGNQLELFYKSSWKPIGLFLKMMHPLIKIVANKNASDCLKRLKANVEA